jgi:hypothetical protein
MFEIGQIIDGADGKQYIVTEIQGRRPNLELLDDYIERTYVVKNKYGENCTIKELINDIKKEMSYNYERCKDRR